MSRVPLLEARQTLVASGPTCVIALAFVAASHLVGNTLFEGMVGLRPYTLQTLAVLLPWCLVGILRIRFAGKGRRESWRTGWPRVFRRLASADFLTGRLIPSAVAFGAVSLVMATFTGWKLSIPYVQPFIWDASLADLDRALHGGTEPWRVLHSLVGYPVITRVIDFLYFPVWYPFIITVFVWRACAPSEPSRTRFLITYLLSWILLGVGFATLVSSGGPVYFGRLTGQTDPFLPLFSYLDGVAGDGGLFARQVQEWLWSVYIGQRSEHFAGIAAMPSMHVAVSYLSVLTVFEARLRIAWAVFIYFSVILVGSIHLGSHYAIDGYVSIVLVQVLWWTAAPLSRAIHGAGRRTTDQARIAADSSSRGAKKSEAAPTGDVMHHGNELKPEFHDSRTYDSAVSSTADTV